MKWRILSVILTLSLCFGTSTALADMDNHRYYRGGNLSDLLSVENTLFHQRMLEKIADRNNGHRASGTSGYEDSLRYVSTLLYISDYKVSYQEFPFPFFEELSLPEFEQILPNAESYPPNDDAGFRTMTYSGSGDVTGVLQAPNDVILPPGPEANTSNCGCEPEDFTEFVAGRVALIQRGSCTYRQKVENAFNAGATAVIIFNEGQTGRTAAMQGTLLGTGIEIPVVGANHDLGATLYGMSLAGEVTVRVMVDGVSEERPTRNIIAETRSGDPDKVVMLGAHLDSVLAGPGINDNGSGTAALLETAMKLAWFGGKPKNKVRFAFWGAEEWGLFGAEHYVAGLTPEELAKIQLYLNFDMIGSSNYARLVYDGDQAVNAEGSRAIEQLFIDYFTRLGLPTDPTDLDGRSDYDPFDAAGIAVGGLFSGADGLKTPELAAKYGGIVGQIFDPYYHTPDDTLANINSTIQEQMLKALGYALEMYATGKATVPAAAARVRTLAAPQAKEYKGPRQVR